MYSKFIFSSVLYVIFASIKITDAFNVTFDPPNNLKVPHEEIRTITWQAYLMKDEDLVSVEYTDQNENISKVIEHFLYPDVELMEDGTPVRVGNFTMEYIFLGYNDVTIRFVGPNNQTLHEAIFETSVIVNYQLINNIFTYSTSFFLLIINFNMGATIDLQVIKKIAIRPIGPIVGMVCQYILMPVLAFGLGLLIFPDDVLLRLGLFLNGCCPGGGGSNMYTLLLGGSLDLSIMMTFCSSVLAFATLPLWVLSLGPVILGDAEFKIPYDQVALIVAMLVIPCGIGIIVQLKSKKMKDILDKTLAPFALFNVLYTFTFGIYANRYIFDFFSWQVALAGMGLPWVGYTFGMVMALLFRLPMKEIVAIGIETGLQNALIALVILKTTLGSPAGDITFVVPACAVLMTPIPLFIAIFVKNIYERCCKKKVATISSGKDNLGMDAVAQNIDKKPVNTISGSSASQDGIVNQGAELDDHTLVKQRNGV